MPGQLWNQGKQAGAPAWRPGSGSSTHRENACSGGRTRARPGAAAAAAPQCPSRSRRWPAPGWAPRPPGARRAPCAMTSRDSTGQRPTCRGKRRCRDSGYRCCSSLLAMPAAETNQLFSSHSSSIENKVTIQASDLKTWRLILSQATGIQILKFYGLTLEYFLNMVNISYS